MVAATPLAALPPGPLVQDPHAARHLLEERRRSGLDRYDEVWDGRYILMPLPGNQHQSIVNRIAFQLTRYLDDAGVSEAVQPGANVSDRSDDWTKNYRCPDVVVYLPGNPAEDRGSHWFGGPDLAVEVLSEGDLALETLPFYASVGVRELWLLDRDPWRLSRFRLQDGALIADGVAEPGGAPVRSVVLPLDWSLSSEEPPAVRLAAAK
ncbi:Uma2 family endonuclease [Alienimonas sp. DA493]|uniref:Uma2 family endonuclease n=1 Tax=Alienimonas sp. DA493 TaxID=3373605 RepID=UPI003753FBA3